MDQKIRKANFYRPTKMEISVTLEKYALFSSNSEVTFTIEGDDHEDIIDQLVDAVEYFSNRYANKLMKT